MGVGWKWKHSHNTQLGGGNTQQDLGGGNLKARTHKSELWLDFSPLQKGWAGKKKVVGPFRT